MSSGSKRIEIHGVPSPPDAVFSIYVPDAGKFTIPRVRSAWFAPDISGQLAMEIVYALRMQVSSYADYAHIIANSA